MRVVVLFMAAGSGGRMVMVVHVIADGAGSKPLHFFMVLRTHDAAGMGRSRVGR
jgi:hypothetical protein